MIQMNKIYHEDCLKGMRRMKTGSVDLIVTDPPYLIESTKAGGDTRLSRSIQMTNDEIEQSNLTAEFDYQILDEMVRVMKKINLYIWCNHKQVPMYLDYFVKQHKCSFDILIWKKTNPPPLFHNKYLTDKKYCLYFRKGGYCQPANYKQATTIYVQPMNVIDKRKYGHPTIKPLNIIKNLVLNSSKSGEVVLDPFMGSGTTAVACLLTKRQYIGFEINKGFYDQALRRLKMDVGKDKR